MSAKTAVKLKKEVSSPLQKVAVTLKIMTVRVIPASQAEVAALVKKAMNIRIKRKLKRRTSVRKKSNKSR